MKLLLAIDDSDYSRTATRAVIEQFRSEGTEVRVLNVVEWPADLSTSVAFAPGTMAGGPIAELYEETHRLSEQLLSRTAELLRASGFTASQEMREGDARHVILECAAEWKPDVIVLGSHGRTGLDRFLLGSVSENVVRHASCSVAIIRGAP
jgi:nucleotide-binding universal stress UspA family protein